ASAVPRLPAKDDTRLLAVTARAHAAVGGPSATTSAVLRNDADGNGVGDVGGRGGRVRAVLPPHWVHDYNMDFLGQYSRVDEDVGAATAGARVIQDEKLASMRHHS
ncbi:hypothetical protein X777_02397, partial [Ooceraea biroi]